MELEAKIFLYTLALRYFAARNLKIEASTLGCNVILGRFADEAEVVQFRRRLLEGGASQSIGITVLLDQ